MLFHTYIILINKVNNLLLCTLTNLYLLFNIYEDFLREHNPVASNAEINRDILSNFPKWFTQYVG